MQVNYQVRLESGRVLGPLELDRIALLIKKNHVIGKEHARVLPDGEWKPIAQFAEIARLLLQAAAPGEGTQTPIAGEDHPIDAATIALSDPEHDFLPGAGGTQGGASSQSIGSIPELEKSASGVKLPSPAEGAEDSDRTMMVPASPEIEDKTQFSPLQELPKKKAPPTDLVLEGDEQNQRDPGPQVTDQPTIVFEGRSRGESAAEHEPAGTPLARLRRIPKPLLAALVIGAVALVFFDDLDSTPKEEPKSALISFTARPPAVQTGKTDAAASDRALKAGIKDYLEDTVRGYARATESFHQAVALDNYNVRALALLASAYINSVDAVRKDEKYFEIITKLIDLSKAKTVDLTETVIADVEFFIMVNRPEAAVARVVEYTKTHATWSPKMFYYIALAYFEQGDTQSAIRFISDVPEDKGFGHRVYHLRGQIAEKVGTSAEAILQYQSAVKLNPNHAVSHLRIAELRYQSGEIGQARTNIGFLLTETRLSTQTELARAYFLGGVLARLDKKLDQALAHFERSVELNPHSSEAQIELYSVQADLGASLKEVQPKAQMYLHLGQGETFVKEGRFDDALNEFLRARDAASQYVLPLVKIGDMFMRQSDYVNAKMNYQRAIDGIEKNKSVNEDQRTRVWSKYIQSLIRNFEWEETQKAIQKFKSVPRASSYMDKLAGDMYARQGLWNEAKSYYRRAMSRSIVDPEVYQSYATSLLETKEFKEAPFFYSLALRYDAKNVDSIVGLGKTLAESESVERAITMLQAENQKMTVPRPEILCAIAELHLQKGDSESAESYAKQAMRAGPAVAFPYKVMAKIYLSREGEDKKAVDRALDAWKSYSDRISSDPTGYLERYRIFLKRGQLVKADGELERILQQYPKFPGLHIYKGDIYRVSNNRELAIEEYRKEYANQPSSVDAMVALASELMSAGQLEEPAALLNKAMQLAPNSSEPKHQAGQLAFLQRNYDGAIALFQSALQIDSGNPIIYRRLGRALLASDRRPEASGAFRKYLELAPDAPDKADIERYL